MKMKYTLLSALIAYCSIAFSQWQPLGNGIIPVNYRTWSVKVAPDSSFWAISTYDAFPPTGHAPKIHRSADGGVTWGESTISLAQSVYGWDISPIDSMTAYVALHSAGLFHTRDGGFNWSKVDAFALPFCLAVHFFNSDEGWLLGSDGTYLTMGLTSDGGNTWTYLGGTNWEQPTGTSLPVMDVDEFISLNFSTSSVYDYTDDAIILGQSKGTYWISTDKGYNWERRTIPLFVDMGLMTTNVAMKDANTFMVASDTRASDFSNALTRSLATRDGGQTWIEGVPGITAAATHYLPQSDSVFIMVGHNDFGLGGEGTAITYDYGETWTQLDNTSIIAIDFIDKNTGIGACCNNTWPTANGQIHRWNFELPTPTFEPAPPSLIHLFPNPALDHLNVVLVEKTNAPFYWVEIFSVDGKRVFSDNYATTNRMVLDIHFLPKGFYSLKITGENKGFIGKFIKQ